MDKTILEALQRIYDRLSGIENVQMQQKLILNDHTRRSLANEKANLLTQKQVDMLRAYVTKAQGIMWFLAGTIAVTAAAAQIYEVFFKG